MPPPNTRSLSDHHDGLAGARMREYEASTTYSPRSSSTIPPSPKKRPRITTPSNTSSSSEPTSAGSGPSPPTPVSSPFSLILDSSISAETHTYTRLSVAELERLPARSVAAYAHSLQRALDITTHVLDAGQTADQLLEASAPILADDARSVSEAVAELIDTPVAELPRAVERAALKAEGVADRLDGISSSWRRTSAASSASSGYAGGWDEVMDLLDETARKADRELVTTDVGEWLKDGGGGGVEKLLPDGMRTGAGPEVRRMCAEVRAVVLAQMVFWPEMRCVWHAQGRWTCHGRACCERHLLALCGMDSPVRGSVEAACPTVARLGDGRGTNAPGVWRVRSLPLAQWKDNFGELEKEIPGQGVFQVCGPSVAFYWDRETAEYHFDGQYGL